MTQEKDKTWQQRFDEEFGIDLVYVTPKGYKQPTATTTPAVTASLRMERLPTM